MAIVTAATDNANYGVIPISCLIGVGLIVFIIAYIQIKNYEKANGSTAMMAGDPAPAQTPTTDSTDEKSE